MDKLNILLLLGVFLTANLSFMYGRPFKRPCNVTHSVSFTVTGGAIDGDGDFTPLVTPKNGSKFQVIGVPTGNSKVVEKNGKKFRTITSSVHVAVKSLSLYTLEEWYGSYKYLGKQPINNMVDICKAEGATVAYPIQLGDANLLKELYPGSITVDTAVAVGIRWTNNKLFDLENKTKPYFEEEILRDKEAEGTGNDCMALFLNPEPPTLRNISCDTELPFFCKKDDGFKQGYGYYSIVPRDKFDNREMECVSRNSTIAFPESPWERYVIAYQGLESDMNIFVGLEVTAPGDYRHIETGELVHIPSDWWAAGNPNPQGDCIALRRREQRLVTVVCEPMSYVCRKDLEPYPSKTLSDGNTYQFEPKHTHAHLANQQCKKKGYQGVAFPTATNWDLAMEMTSLFPDTVYNITTNIVRKWNGFKPHIEDYTSGAKVDLGRYVLNEEEALVRTDWNCISFLVSGHFYFYHCDEELPYICLV